MISSLWNTFLDTTPRQWGHKIQIGAANLMSAMNPLHILKLDYRSYANGWVIASIAIHITIYVAVVAPGGLAVTLNKADGYEIEFIPVARPAGDDVEAIYDEESEIVVRVPKKVKKKEKSLAEKLLSKYQKVYVGGVANVEEEKNLDQKPDWRKAKPSYRVQTAQAGKIDMSKHLDAAAQLDAKNQIPGLSKDQLTQHLAQYQGRFQSCYEAALLKDESLNGKVRFELKTGPTGNVTNAQVTFDGVGLPTTRSELQTCLQVHIREIRFPSTLSAAFNRTVQFQAVLSL